MSTGVWDLENRAYYESSFFALPERSGGPSSGNIEFCFIVLGGGRTNIFTLSSAEAYMKF